MHKQKLSTTENIIISLVLMTAVIMVMLACLNGVKVLTHN